MEKEEMEFFEKIERYLEGKLTESEKIELQKALSNDPDLLKEAEINKVIIETLKNRNLLRIKNDVDQAMNIVKRAMEHDSVPFEQSHGEKPKRSIQFSNSLLKIAAVISILILSIIAIIKLTQSNSVDSIVISYLGEPYQAPPFYRAPQESAENWKQNYQSRNFVMARNILEGLVQSDDKNLEAQFYLGLCYLYQPERDPKKAIDQFNNVLAGKSRYEEQAMWYLGLSYYLAGNKQAAVNTLRKVRGVRQEAAASLLQKLN
ncbi:tetratricopeptide repeat protein [Fulvivirgaceae bacterium BMA10]|uniref:Tetratricopeptide repeat protein n=1 Tax=Splendidivirga corallicola TaxID=3051826 RepID=A0ABT8KX44_9BACT|nr:tetratricopeptide repeat protein [Fulvivirgaceae bacterium BMA10]